jgi:hypothetical protein
MLAGEAMNASVEISPYLHRREQLFAKIGDNVAIIPTAPELARNRDTDFLYRHDSYFYYLTGFAEPKRKNRSSFVVRKILNAKFGTVIGSGLMRRATCFVLTKRIPLRSWKRCCPNT